MLERQRCNHCMTIQSEENFSCEKCGKDDALMHPFDDYESLYQKHKDLILVCEKALSAINWNYTKDRMTESEITEMLEKAIAKAKGE